MFDIVLIEERLERVISMFPVPSWDELGTVIGQDLAGESIFTEPLDQDSDNVLGVEYEMIPFVPDPFSLFRFFMLISTRPWNNSTW